MLALTETGAEFSSLTRLFKQQVSALFADVQLQGDPVSLPACPNAAGHGMRSDHIYLVKGGMLNTSYKQKHLATRDEGDLILPDAGGQQDPVVHAADAPVLLVGYDANKLMQELLTSASLTRRWMRLVMVQQALWVRLLAAQTDIDTIATPGFAYFQPGDIILQQGDPADAVFSLFEGDADVLVNDVKVGSINEGEILGAMAVLTESARSATVRANSRCSVVKVPRDQFESLIRTNPAMIHKLLADMALQIQKMNEKVVSLNS